MTTNSPGGWLTNGVPELALTDLTGAETFPVDTHLANGTNPQQAAVLLSTIGFGAAAQQTVAAAGSNKATGTAIASTAPLVYVTVTASTEGVVLPTAATGLRFWITPSPTVGINVYANTGDKIGTATTATTAYALAKNTVTTFWAVDAQYWHVLKGG